MAPLRPKKQAKARVPSKTVTMRSPTPMKTPERSPIKERKMAITEAQKQALIDNLQLEITERARKLRATYAVHSQGLRSRLEMRVNRIPRALRQMNIVDLLDQISAQQKPPLPPPAQKAATKALPKLPAPAPTREYERAPVPVTVKPRAPRTKPAAPAEPAAPIEPAAPAPTRPIARARAPSRAVAAPAAPAAPATRTIGRPTSRAAKAAPKPAAPTKAEPASKRPAPARGTKRTSNEMNKENVQEIKVAKKRAKAAPVVAAPPAPAPRTGRVLRMRK